MSTFVMARAFRDTMNGEEAAWRECQNAHQMIMNGTEKTSRIHHPGFHVIHHVIAMASLGALLEVYCALPSCSMSESSFFDMMMLRLRESCRYYTGYPKDLGSSRVIHFTSEREFVQLLHQGYPVVVAFTIKGNYTKHLDKVLEEAAANFYPNVKFMRVECPKYPGFCIARQRKEYPFIEIFHSPEQAAAQGKIVDPNVTKYSVKVLPFNYDVSTYGFKEYFKRHSVQMTSRDE